MKLSTLKNHLANAGELSLQLPGGEFVPPHFHITEMGLLTKHFIDCGGTIREERYATMQVWTANDVDHRLTPSKLRSIIAKAAPMLGDQDPELEVEYQGTTIGKYGLEIENGQLVLTAKQTNCLAQDHCGIPVEKLKVPLSALQAEKASCCSPASGCC